MLGDGTLPESPHPLTSALIAAVAPGSRVLVIGIGGGRHLATLAAAGITVDAIEAEPARAAVWPASFPSGFDGALATHALLHGRPGDIAATLAAVRARLRAGAPFHFTLGSRRDPRYGRGTRLEEATWAPDDGDEAGVAHTYFDERGARALLASWELLSLEERDASATAGAWAHASGTAGLVHWFVRARRRSRAQ